MPSTKKIVACLPTYNEARNITDIISSILALMPHLSILVIDDNSPDGTGLIVDALSRKDNRIILLKRQKKQGLGPAYSHGFRFAVAKMQADYVIQMDADLSHPPELLPLMVHHLLMADLVIGSRYVPGGKTRNWNLMRRCISRFGSLYARLWLGLSVYDATSGFKAWRSDLLREILKYPIGSGGYVFQVETTYRAQQLGACILEVPICFTDRYVGKSKMTMAIAFEAFWRIPALRFQTKHFSSIQSVQHVE